MKFLFGHFAHHEFSILAEHDDVIYVRTICHVFVFLQPIAYETLQHGSHYNFFISYSHFRGLYAVKYPQFGFALSCPCHIFSSSFS